MSMKNVFHMEDFVILWIKTLLYLSVFLRLNTAVIVTDELYTVCPGEQRTTLMCSTNHTFLEWSVSAAGQVEPTTRSISYFDQIIVVQPILMNSINFTLSRVSPPGVLPLVTTMMIMNITSNLEGTVISCSGLNGSLGSSVVLMTTIHVYDMDVDFPNTPEIIRPDMVKFGNNNFTVVLEWSQFSGETYSVVTVPEPVNMSFTRSTSIQLVLLYDTEYNVSVTAMLCGHRNTSNFTTLYFYYTEVSQSTTIDISTAIPILPTDSHKTIANSRSQSKIDGPLVGSLIGISIAIVMSLVSIITVVIVIFKRRGLHLKTIKINTSSDNSAKSQDLHCEADKSGTVVYAEVFSSSLIRPKHQFESRTLELYDDRVNYAEVKHNLISVTHNIDISEVDCLLNLDNLLIHIKQDATQMWYQLGEALGIEKAILDKFTTYSPEQSIIEMLDYWLRSHTGKPTWKEVANALRKIHLHELASGLEMIYKTGKLSAAIDFDVDQNK